MCFGFFFSILFSTFKMTHKINFLTYNKCDLLQTEKTLAKNSKWRGHVRSSKQSGRLRGAKA